MRRSLPRNGRCHALASGAPGFFGSGGFFTPDGKARILPLAPPPPRDRGPGHLILNTGRVRDHWHTMTRTGRTPRLSAHYAEPFAEIRPDDAERLSIRRTQLVRLENGYGTAIVRALVTDRQQKGSIFVPMHWTGETAATGRVNALLGPFADPVSGQPALKMGRVSATPVEVALYGFLVSRRKPDVGGLGYWAVAPAPEGWRAEIAVFERPEDVFAHARAILRLPPDVQLTTSLDARSGRISLVCFEGDRLDCALYLSPDPVLAARQWVVEQLGETHDVPLARARLLSGRPGADQPDPGPLVCSCFGVGANQIADAVVGGCTSVADIGDVLGAGTNCGSCRTEIGRIIDANRLAAAE